jgi:glycosyltransferase involved in cell wall biosynthesis
MGKRKKNNNNNKNKYKEKSDTQKLPFVSVCTPTFNRRPFIENIFKCFKNQDYPMSRLEWIIIDDGTDKIEDLIETSGIPQIKYFKYDKKMTLGKKRNLMHEKSTGTIIVYMDDDDYYPPTRISHAVDKLKKNPKAIAAGSSIIHVFFKHINKIVEFGPYGPNHATAGTFAFKRELLNQTQYNEEAALAEEKEFLKNYTIPFVQLDPRHCILVFSHEHNTFDKRKLLENRNPQVTKDIDDKVSSFVKEQDIYDFFMKDIDKLLENYEPGLPKHKPDVLKQTIEIQAKRDKMIKEQMEQMKIQGKRIMLSDQNDPNNKREATMGEVVTLFETAQKQVNELNNKVNELKQLAGARVIITDNNTKQQREATFEEIAKLCQMEQNKNKELTNIIINLKQENELLKQNIKNNLSNENT